MAAMRAKLSLQMKSDLVNERGCSDPITVLWEPSDGNKQDTRWKRFLMPESSANPKELATQTDVLILVNSMLHALIKNPAIASQLIRTLGQRDGMGVEVIERFAKEFEYSESAGRKRELVSFQRGLVPFFIALTSRAMLSAAQMNIGGATYIYSCVFDNWEALFDAYIEKLVMVVDHGNIEDLWLSHERFLEENSGTWFAPLCFTQIVLPLLTLANTIAAKFPKILFEPSFRRSVNKIDELVDEWFSKHPTDNLDTVMACGMMQDLLERLNSMIDHSARSVARGKIIQANRAEIHSNSALVDPVKQQWNIVPAIAPGAQQRKDGTVGRRHDNDHVSIKDIRILPTTQEILSPYDPALPGNFTFLEGAHWLPPGPERWIDTHFRLFREDMCKILRDSMQDLLSRFRGHQFFQTGRIKGEKVDFSVYELDSMLLRMYHTGKNDRSRRIQRGMCADVQFSQSTLGVNIKQADRTRFWENSGRLRLFSMVCLVRFDGTELNSVFCQIVIRDIPDLVKDRAKITIQPYDSDDLQFLLRWERSDIPIYLLEVNKLFFDSYEPVLKALQDANPLDMPFIEYLAPEFETDNEITMIEAPFYSQHEGFTFDLSSCVSAAGLPGGRHMEGLLLNPRDIDSQEVAIRRLMNCTTLEHDQAGAVVGALSNRVACIQGLPGSGKSFIGNIITQVILKASVYPILVVCYTNHALDQFLCHLLDSGITKIVRIGGQSKEPRLEPYNMAKIKKPYNNRELAILYEKLNNAAEALDDTYNDMTSNAISWQRLRYFLQHTFPNCYDSLMERNDILFDGEWSIAGSTDILDYWLKGMDGAPTRTAPPVDYSGEYWHPRLQQEDMWNLTRYERQMALKSWRQALWLELQLEFRDAQRRYTEVLEELSAVRDAADVAILRQAQVIGMTTTGVAKHRHKIAAVGPKVLVCEEAGEVLEAQLMACLTQSCQHMILIGDHQQLRPHIAVYDLSVESKYGQKFRLDVSMFERLVSPSNGGAQISWWTLTQQHRMRPQISQFVRTLFYPNLRDAEETHRYPNVKGVNKNVFFVNHNHPEDGVKTREQQHTMSIRSHSNSFEVEYIVGLLRYLMRQGYQTSEIAIITPYVSQLLAIREVLRGEFVIQLSELDQAEMEQELGEVELIEAIDAQRFESATQKKLSQVIRLATVDNFQGEEAEIILVSLVRSALRPEENGRSTIGFLKTSNRINVLMSRAKHGLYLVGHGELLREKSDLWEKILETMIADGCFGDGLPIHCQKHPDDHRIVKIPQDFQRLAPNGGCLRPCSLRLPNCGHVCRMMCHTDRKSHATIYCMQPCLRLHDECQHPCSKNCGDKCGQCETVVGAIRLSCGHIYNNAKCWETKNPQKVKCEVLVEREVHECGHIIKASCGVKKTQCSRECGISLSCGHLCRRNCSVCVEETITANAISGDQTRFEYPIKATSHGTCRKTCDRMLSCQHRCQAVCHIGAADAPDSSTPCPPCSSKCEIFQCAHGKCEHVCSRACSACCEDCSWRCEHAEKCGLPCGAPCVRQLCNKRCSKLLACGHQCPSVCGEICPSTIFCQVCASPGIREKQVDLIMFESYGEIDLDIDPILVLSCCRAIYTRSSLDGVVGLSSVYDKNGLPLELPREYMEKIPQCPNCNQPIRGLNRYGRVTKRAAIDAAERKFMEMSQRTLVMLQQRFQALASLDDVTEEGAQAQHKTLVVDIELFAKSVKQPPCHKVLNACLAKLAKDKSSKLHDDRALRLLPVPNSKFPFVGQANLLLGRSYLLVHDGKRAEQYSRAALQRFEGASYTIHSFDTRLVLAQALFLKAGGMLQEETPTLNTNKTQTKVLEKKQLVEMVCVEIENVLGVLSARYKAEHAGELSVMGQRLDKLRRCASGQAFYEGVTDEELRAVRMAMQTEFLGSGHWYRCPNGHSYSVGECGMPMERARCPECGATVGGTDHMSAEGNTHNTDIERL